MGAAEEEASIGDDPVVAVAATTTKHNKMMSRNYEAIHGKLPSSRMAIWRRRPTICGVLPLLLLHTFCLLATSTEASALHRRRQADSMAHQPSVLFRYQCPQGCLCVPDIVDIELLIVSCRWPRLRTDAFEHFPRNGTKSLAIQCTQHGLDLNGESALARDGTFQGFTELKELRISGCQSRHLASDLFRGATRLDTLSLSQMPAMERLEPDFFVPLAQLEKLTLAETGLLEFPDDGLCLLQKLQVLNVSQNRLQSARLGIHLLRPADQPCQLGQLLMLDLSGNGIHVLAEQDLRPFPALRQLSLRGNELVEIQPDTFRSGAVPLLQHLDLSSNRLVDVPTGLPQGLLNLDLANNQFQRFPEAAIQLAGLTRLNLSGNAIGDEQLLGIAIQSSGLEQLDLSWNRLERVPVEAFAEAADSLKILRMAGNAIAQLGPGQMQNLSSLEELDLSSNRLTNLPFGAFDGLAELGRLQLANNSIEDVDSEAFQELSSLHTLSMNHNKLTKLPVGVGRLTRIKRMDFSNNQISQAYKHVLNKLQHLSRLDLSHNAMESVDSYVFRECEHLQELNLKANRILTMSPDAFEKCPKLKRLDLAENQLLMLGPALTLLTALRSLNLTGNALEELNWAQLPLDLLEIFANSNKIRRITPLATTSDEANNDERKLKRLELKGNRLIRLSADSLPLALEELDLSENHLVHLTNISFYHGLTQLKMVNLRSNKLRTIPRELFDLAVGANAPFGRMWIAQNPLECNCEMGWLLNASVPTEGTGGVRDIAEAECSLPLSGTKKQVTLTVPADFLCPYTQICASGCICCAYMGCDCKSRCPKGCQCFRDLHAVTNVVKCTGETGANGHEEFNLRELPMMASHILLSDLNIPVLKNDSFFGRERLLELHINASQIHTIHSKAFNTCKNLQDLHLANNALEWINGDESFNTPNIRLLNLANNKISGVNSTLNSTAPMLEELFLEGNSLEELPAYLKNSPGNHLRHLSLAHNPFRCDCATSSRYYETAHWLARNRVRVLDADGMECVENVTRAKATNDSTVLSIEFPNVGDDLFVMPMLEFLGQENRSFCISRNYGVFGIGGFFDVFLFFMAMVALLLLLPMLLLFILRPKWFESLWTPPYPPQNPEEKAKFLGPLHNYHWNSSNSPSNSPGTSISDGEASGSPTMEMKQCLAASPTNSNCVEMQECDFFICYAKRDHQKIRQLFRPWEEEYAICYLHQCRYFNPDGANISDELQKLMKNSRVLVLFISHEFLRTVWEMPQFSSSYKLLKKSRILIIAEEDMNAIDMDKLPPEFGDPFRQAGLYRNIPHFLEALKNNALNLLFNRCRCHSYLSDSTEYAQIPQAPKDSDFV